MIQPGQSESLSGPFLAGGGREESSKIHKDLSPERLEMAFPEESPLAVRVSKTTSRDRQRRYRESLGTVRRAEGVAAHSTAPGSPEFCGISSLKTASYLQSIY